jgi:hypothetical protein
MRTGGLASPQKCVLSDFGRLHIRYQAANWVRGFIDLVRPVRAAGLTTRPGDKISPVATELGPQ